MRLSAKSASAWTKRTRTRTPTPTPTPTPPTPAPGAPPLVFGIYPGGAAGAVGPSGPLQPEDPAKRLAALQQLRSTNAPFVLHIYAGYTGSGGYSASAQVGADIASYTAAGFQVELVLCYRPSDLNPSVDVPGFVSFARSAADQLGRSLVSLQVTNEANVAGAPNASDGYYPGAKDALIQGVIGAKAQSASDGFNQVKVGFNWAYQTGASETSFWTYLGQHGGQALAGATDWVGIDAYPGTWQALPAGLTLAAGVRQSTILALRTLRETYMPLAALPAGTPMHVSEMGYPTGPGRTVEMQSTVISSAVQAVYDSRAAYNVTDYRWFDLRDANSSSSSFEDQYGLMTDTYAPKPAFAVYKGLVAAL